MFWDTFLEGNPYPQGSKHIVQPKGFKRPMLREGGNSKSAQKHSAWREQMQAQLAQMPPCDEEFIGAYMAFFLPMPASYVKSQPEIRHANKSYDLDKLVRAVGDALQKSKIITNDSRIVEVEAQKFLTSYPLTGVYVSLFDVQVPLLFDQQYFKWFKM